MTESRSVGAMEEIAGDREPWDGDGCVRYLDCGDGSTDAYVGPHVADGTFIAVYCMLTTPESSYLKKCVVGIWLPSAARKTRRSLCLSESLFSSPVILGGGAPASVIALRACSDRGDFIQSSPRREKK